MAEGRTLQEAPELLESLEDVEEVRTLASSATDIAETVDVEFFDVVRAEVPLLAWIPLVHTAGIFRTSRSMCDALSMLATVDVRLEVVTREASNVGEGHRLKERRRARVQACRARLPHAYMSEAPPVYLEFPITSMPVDFRGIGRRLRRLVPWICWEGCPGIRIRCRGDLPLFKKTLWPSVAGLNATDLHIFLANPAPFTRLTRLELSLAQLSGLPAQLCLPKVRRVKVLCHDATLSEDVLLRIAETFPALNRLHLALKPCALPALAGQPFEAPPDFRLSLLEDEGFRGGVGCVAHVGSSGMRHDQQANFFITTHLLGLPFSWQNILLRRVQRLQMSELREDYGCGGLALESFFALLRELPHLRRLGTLSRRCLSVLDLTREDCFLEEVVVEVEVNDLISLFRLFVPVDKVCRRMTLRRLAVHLLATDGAPRLKLAIEDAACACWHSIAQHLLHPQGFIAFSIAHRQLLETAFVQLPWFDPQRFCLDTVEYSAGDRLPVCTPLNQSLPHSQPSQITRPRGTLVTGALRPPVATTSDIASSFISRRLSLASALSGSDREPLSPMGHVPAFAVTAGPRNIQRAPAKRDTWMAVATPTTLGTFKGGVHLSSADGGFHVKQPGWSQLCGVTCSDSSPKQRRSCGIFISRPDSRVSSERRNSGVSSFGGVGSRCSSGVPSSRGAHGPLGAAGGRGVLGRMGSLSSLASPSPGTGSRRLSSGSPLSFGKANTDLNVIMGLCTAPPLWKDMRLADATELLIKAEAEVLARYAGL